MEIIKMWPENSLDKKQVYQATHSTCTTLQTLPDGTVLHVDSFLVYKDVNNRGEEVEVTVVFDKSANEHYATISQNVRNCITSYVEFMGAELDENKGFDLTFVRAKTKAGRDFLNASIV